jgi:hypothetical protein
MLTRNFSLSPRSQEAQKGLRYEHEERALLSKNKVISAETILRTVNLRGIYFGERNDRQRNLRKTEKNEFLLGAGQLFRPLSTICRFETVGLPKKPKKTDKPNIVVAPNVSVIC